MSTPAEEMAKAIGREEALAGLPRAERNDPMRHGVADRIVPLLLKGQHLSDPELLQAYHFGYDGATKEQP